MCQVPVAWLSTVRCTLPAASLPALPRCQGKLCKLRCKVGNTFWPRPKPDCAASELIAHMQTDRETNTHTHTHALSLSLSTLLPSSLSLSLCCCMHSFSFTALACRHTSPQRVVCRSRRCTPQTHLAKLHCLAMSSHRSRLCLVVVVVAIVKR